MTGERLVEAAELMDRLWGYGGWEVRQTHESLAKYLREEVYELLDAIDSGDPAEVREELGDLLLQVLFHARIAQAAGQFDVDDVAGGLIDKLTARSPHLGDEATGELDPVEQELAWEAAKNVEKARASSLDGIASSQPVDQLAEQVIERTGLAGMPGDLVPGELRFALDDAIAAQGVLRARVEDFARRVRVAEAKAREAGEWPMTPENWRRALTPEP